MAAASLARGRNGENGAPQVSCIAPMCENRDRAEYGKPSTTKKQSRRTKPVATSAVSLARMNQESTPCWVNCASAQIIWCVASRRLVPTHARRLARHLTHVRRGGAWHAPLFRY